MPKKLKISYREFCESGPYFDIRPARETKIGIRGLAGKLEGIGEVSAINEFFACLRIGGCEATLYGKGKVIVKGTKKKEEAERIACKIYKKAGIAFQ